MCVVLRAMANTRPVSRQTWHPLRLHKDVTANNVQIQEHAFRVVIEVVAKFDGRLVFAASPTKTAATAGRLIAFKRSLACSRWIIDVAEEVNEWIYEGTLSLRTRSAGRYVQNANLPVNRSRAVFPPRVTTPSPRWHEQMSFLL